jgi:anti-sigma regulatory factor (Ser/Thr protein kinase)
VAGELGYRDLDILGQALAQWMRLDRHMHVSVAGLDYVDGSRTRVIVAAAKRPPKMRRMTASCCRRRVAIVFGAGWHGWRAASSGKGSMAGPDRSGPGSGGRSRVDGPEVVMLDQPFDAEGLYAVRAAVAAHADQLGIPDDQLVDLLIVAAELAANAIRHGGGGGRLRLWRDGVELHCQVSDHGAGIADVTVGTTPPKPTDTRGRGLWICRQLSDTFIVQRGDQGSGAVVTAVIRLDGEPSPRADTSH